MPKLILLPWDDVLTLNEGELVINITLVNHLTHTYPESELAIIKKSREPLSEYVNRRRVIYADKDISVIFMQKFAIRIIFLDPESLTALLRDPEKDFVCYSSDLHILAAIKGCGGPTVPLVQLPYFCLKDSHVAQAIVGIRNALRDGRKVIFFVDMDLTLVVPDDEPCPNWTFNPAVFDLLFQLRSVFPNAFEQFEVKILTSRVPVEQLNDTDKAEPYSNTNLLVIQFHEILRRLGIKIRLSLQPNPIIALGEYRVCPIEKVDIRFSSKTKAQYLVEQSSHLSDTTFILIDDCPEQSKAYQQALASNCLPTERAFFIEVDANASKVVATLSCLKSASPQPSSYTALSFLAAPKEEEAANEAITVQASRTNVSLNIGE